MGSGAAIIAIHAVTLYMAVIAGVLWLPWVARRFSTIISNPIGLLVLALVILCAMLSIDAVWYSVSRINDHMGRDDLRHGQWAYVVLATSMVIPLSLLLTMIAHWTLESAAATRKAIVVSSVAIALFISVAVLLW